MKASRSFCAGLMLFVVAPGCASKADSEPKLAANDAGMQPDAAVMPMDSGVEASTDAAVEAGPMVPAFPGAVGWAGNTPGGRGGQILRVTTLARGQVLSVTPWPTRGRASSCSRSAA